eukprot:gene5401-5635_t
MAAVPQLATGVLPHLLSSDSYNGAPLLVQVLDAQHIKPKESNATSRTKVVLSDGQYKCTALLASQLKEIVGGGQVVKGSIVRLKELVGNKRLGNGGKKLLIILNLDVVGHYENTIGNPQTPPDVPDEAAQPAPPGIAGGGYGGPPQTAAGPGMYGNSGAGPAYGMGAGPVAHSGEPLRIVPIRALNPYLARWTIKARCSQKGEVRRWSNPRTEGKLMSFDLVDADGSEIRVTAWNDQVDQFQDMVQVGGIYQISKASLKPRNAKFNNTPHDYEVYLERGSTVQPCEEDHETRAIPMMMFHFRKLAELETMEAGAIVDVVGIVDSVQDWTMITRKDGSDTRKRSLTLRDDSGRSVEVTLWDKFVETPGQQLEQMVRAGEHPVVACKGMRVGDFNGKNLSSLGSSTVAVAPDRPEAQALRRWYDQGGSTAAVTTLSSGGGMGRQDRRVTFSQIKSEGLGCNGTADWVAVTGIINYIKSENMTYPSCPRDFNGRTCQKKLQDQDNNNWYCERCSAAVEQPAWRYLLNLQAQDHTDNQWLTAFGDAGEVIMKRPADAFARLEEIDNLEFGSLMNECNFRPYLFKLKVLQDNFSDDQRVKVSISKIQPLDFVQEGRVLLDFIHKLDQGLPGAQAGRQHMAGEDPSMEEACMEGQVQMGLPSMEMASSTHISSNSHLQAGMEEVVVVVEVASQAWAELELWENSESLLSFASRLATAVCAGALQHAAASMMPAATAEQHCCLLFEVHAKRFCTAWNLKNQALAKHAADCARLAAEDLAPCASVKVQLCLELSQLLQQSVQQAMAAEEYDISPALLEVLQLAFELANQAQEAADEWRKQSVKAVAADASNNEGSRDEHDAVEKLETPLSNAPAVSLLAFTAYLALGMLQQAEGEATRIAQLCGCPAVTQAAVS